MNTQLKNLLTAAIAFALCSGAALAAAPADQVARLGKDLTPVGAEKGPNADGTIPAWQGGITQPPAGYRIGQQHIDPFADDKPLFTITAANAKTYADKLGPGEMAMFQKYPDYKMIVYPSRRSASFPQRTLDYTVKNASTCKLVADGEGVENCAEGFPFPIPGNAKELMWNHKLKFKGVAVQRYFNQAAPTANGDYTLVRLKEEFLGLYYKPGNTVSNINNILFYFFQEVEGPARLAGNVLLVHETLNAAAQPRLAWVYNSGQRRVRRAPNVAYDNPGTASDGLRTNDMFDMFNGAMDRFDWTLVGKREMYVPYNDYRLKTKGTKVADVVKPGHLNQDLVRYELHRVWVVDAKLKPDQRHINSRRTFYLDEDSYQILMAEHYDNNGALWRFSSAFPINYYELPTVWSALEAHYDLKSGRYICSGLDQEDKPYDFALQSEQGEFSPQSLRSRGVR